MDDHRFDTLTRALAARPTRRAALGGLAVALLGLGAGRTRGPSAAQNAATPGASPLASPPASPAASPSPLDLIAGSPPASGNALTREGECKANGESCLDVGDAVCCSGICTFWRAAGMVCSSIRNTQ